MVLCTSLFQTVQHAGPVDQGTPKNNVFKNINTFQIRDKGAYTAHAGFRSQVARVCLRCLGRIHTTDCRAVGVVSGYHTSKQNSTQSYATGQYAPAQACLLASTRRL